MTYLILLLALTFEKNSPQDGSCIENPCHPEAECKDLPNTAHTCICKNGSYLYENNKCPRNEIESTTSVSVSVSNVSTSVPKENTNVNKIKITAVFGVVATVVLLFVIFFGLSFRIVLKKRQAPRSLPNVSAGWSDCSAIDMNECSAMNQEYFDRSLLTSADALDPSMITYLNKSSISSMKEIGQGCFGTVYKALLTHTDGKVETVAIKLLKDQSNAEAKEDFMKEVAVMVKFKHPNILTLIGVCPQEGVSSPWMVFEYMEYGDLTEVLRNSNEVFLNHTTDKPVVSQNALLDIALQIATGMAYLASQRFVHRDLACRNCLVGHDMNVKIADFGMSRDVYSCDYYQAKGSRFLPLRWMSPESIEYRKFTMESDVWSFGVVLWEIFTLGKTPYYEYSNDMVLKLIPQGKLLEIPKDCPPVISKLMKECWKLNPKARIGFADIHKCLKNASRGHGLNDSLQVNNVEHFQNHPIPKNIKEHAEAYDEL